MLLVSLRTSSNWVEIKVDMAPRQFYPLRSNKKGGEIGCADTIFAFYVICMSFCTIYKIPWGNHVRAQQS